MRKTKKPKSVKNNKNKINPKPSTKNTTKRKKLRLKRRGIRLHKIEINRWIKELRPPKNSVANRIPPGKKHLTETTLRVVNPQGKLRRTESLLAKERA